MPAPIDVQIAGSDHLGNYNVARQLANRIRAIPGAVDVHVQQAYDAPALRLDVDRTFAQSVGLSQRDVAGNLLVSLSSSFQTAPTFWLNPRNGISYNVAVQTPQYRVDSVKALLDTPIRTPNSPDPQILGNLASFRHGSQPAVISHYNVQPLVDVFASVQGRDLGGVAGDVRRVVQPLEKQLPQGSHLTITGQVSTMSQSFIGLGAGVAMAIVLAYLLIVVNFQSWLDPFIIITALPGALAGITWALLLTHTTLNASSLFGVGYDESSGGDADGTDSLAKRCHRLKIHGWFWFSFHRMVLVLKPRPVCAWFLWRSLPNYASDGFGYGPKSDVPALLWAGAPGRRPDEREPTVSGRPGAAAALAGQPLFL